MTAQKKAPAKQRSRSAAAASTRSATKRTPAKSAANKTATRAASSKSSRQKDPQGGLTAAGRKAFAEKEGAHLRPGVQGPADTPEKMLRKGSFLRRHFAHPRGPMQRDGEPTRLALSAHAWGEPVPKTEADARKLAAKGKKLLDRYHQAKDGKDASAPARKSPARKSAKSAAKSSQR